MVGLRGLSRAAEGGRCLKPAAVFDGFLDNVTRAYRLIQDADAALRAQPPRIDREEAQEIERVAADLLQRAMTTLTSARCRKHCAQIGLKPSCN